MSKWDLCVAGGVIESRGTERNKERRMREKLKTKRTEERENKKLKRKREGWAKKAGVSERIEMD